MYTTARRARVLHDSTMGDRGKARLSRVWAEDESKKGERGRREQEGQAGKTRVKGASVADDSQKVECGRREQKGRIGPSTLYLPCSVLDNFSVFTVAERPTKLTPDDSNSAFDTLRIARHLQWQPLLYEASYLNSLQPQQFNNISPTGWNLRIFFFKPWKKKKCRTFTKSSIGFYPPASILCLITRQVDNARIPSLSVSLRPSL